MASDGLNFTSVCAIAVFLLASFVTHADCRSLKSAKSEPMSVSKRIIGGYPVRKGDSPFLVSLQIVNVENRTSEHMCGASVIMGRFLLTAAHCVLWTRKNPENIKAFLGTLNSGSMQNHDNHSHVEDTKDFRSNAINVIEKLLNGEKILLENNDEESDEEDVVRRGESESSSAIEVDADMEYEACIKKIIIHADYNDSSLVNDIAILVMAMDIPERIRSKVVPISLPTAAMEREGYPAAGTECTVYGWGRSHAAVTTQEYYDDNIIEAAAKELNTEIRNDTVCRNFYEYLYAYKFDYDKKSMFCAGSIGDNYGGTYKGDSGGPVVCGYAGKYYQAGIVSGGSLDMGAFMPGFYTRVTTYEEWIKKAIANNL